MLEERLRAVPLFRALPAERLADLRDALVASEPRAGELVFRMGDPSDALYLVDEGQVEVSRSGETVAVLGPGSFVGEMGLLLDEVRSADLRAVTDVRLWALPRAAVDALLAEHPDLAIELSRQLSSRLAATTSRLTPAGSAPTITAVWGASRVRELADQVAAILGVEPAVVDAGGPMPEGATHVLAVLPGDHSRLARSVLRSARHVVCFRPPAAWVTARHGPHRVLRCDGRVGIERAARWITGRSVGLALSSGGSKTVAHIGVIQVLAQHGVPIDVVAGSSGGALVALALGAGHGPDTMTRHLRELAELLNVRRWDVNVPPRTGLIKGRRLRDAIDRWFEGRTFADLLLPTAVVATELSTGTEVVIDSGPVADAARASLSIPGVFDPWPLDGRPMIDGAVVDPLPTSVVRDRGAGVVIASNVAGKPALDDADPGLTDAPGVMQTMLRMVNLMERELLKVQLPLADVVVRPSVAANYSFDFTQIDEFVAEGARAATETLASVRREGRVLLP